MVIRKSVGFKSKSKSKSVKTKRKSSKTKPKLRIVSKEEADLRQQDLEYIEKQMKTDYNMKNIFWVNLNEIATGSIYPDKGMLGQIRMKIFDDKSLSQEQENRLEKLIRTSKVRKMRGHDGRGWLHFLIFADQIEEEKYLWGDNAEQIHKQRKSKR